MGSLIGVIVIARYIAFLDESGSPEMNPQSIDKNFPVLTLACCVIEIEYYLNVVNPAVDRLKYEFFGHRGTILHSSEIRKRVNDFRILNNKDTNTRFINRINQLITTLDYTIIASSIHKIEHLNKYVYPKPPYDLTFEFVYEKLYFFLKNLPGGPHECFFLAESRNENQNAELRAVFNRLRTQGNRYFSADEFKRYVTGLYFHPKSYNETGNQLADLIAYPISRYTLNKDAENKPFEILSNKIYKGPEGNKINFGLKIFP
jgi:hypothetical protein